MAKVAALSLAQIAAFLPDLALAGCLIPWTGKCMGSSRSIIGCSARLVWTHWIAQAASGRVRLVAAGVLDEGARLDPELLGDDVDDRVGQRFVDPQVARDRGRGRAAPRSRAGCAVDGAAARGPCPPAQARNDAGPRRDRSAGRTAWRAAPARGSRASGPCGEHLETAAGRPTNLFEVCRRRMDRGRSLWTGSGRLRFRSTTASPARYGRAARLG